MIELRWVNRKVLTGGDEETYHDGYENIKILQYRKFYNIEVLDSVVGMAIIKGNDEWKDVPDVGMIDEN